MEKAVMLQQISMDLNELCVKISNRHVGSPGNREAGQYAARRMTGSGLDVDQPNFDCIDWEHGDVLLTTNGNPVESFTSPYSPSCELNCYFETASTIDELETRDFTGKIAVFHGDLCKEQIVPRNYTFYNRDEHQKILNVIDQKNPLAIIAITSRNPETTGGEYPFPLFEDGDFNIPSVYLTEEEGLKLLNTKDALLYLKIVSKRIPSKGFNVIGAKPGNVSQKIIFCAHIDTKKNTPGALDNATGVVTLLTLADMLEGYTGKYGVELLVVNGEDYYAASGQMKYIADHQDLFNQMILAVNIDGAGYIHGKNGYCCLNCNELLTRIVDTAFGDDQKFVLTEPWYQSDHSWFMMHGVPAMAVTSEQMMETLMTEITHTPNDSPEKVDIGKIYDIASAMRNLIDLLNQSF